MEVVGIARKREGGEKSAVASQPKDVVKKKLVVSFPRKQDARKLPAPNPPRSDNKEVKGKQETGRPTSASRGGDRFTDRKLKFQTLDHPQSITVEKQPKLIDELFMVSLPPPRLLPASKQEKVVEHVGDEVDAGEYILNAVVGEETYIDRVVIQIELDPSAKIWEERPWNNTILVPFLGAIPFSETPKPAHPREVPPLPDVTEQSAEQEPSHDTHAPAPKRTDSKEDMSTKVVPTAKIDNFDKELEDAILSVIELNPTLTVKKIHCLGETVRLATNK